MLAFNKAYRLMFAKGWSGRLEFLGWLARAPVAG